MVVAMMVMGGSGGNHLLDDVVPTMFMRMRTKRRVLLPPKGYHRFESSKSVKKTTL